MGTRNQRSDHKWRGNKDDAMEEERLAILNKWKNGDAQESGHLWRKEEVG